MQCIAQESTPEEYLYLLEKRNKRRREKGRPTFFSSVPLSHTESLVEWGGLTEEFNSVVVLIENPETIPPTTLDSLLAIMTNLRSIHGLPISLVFLPFRDEEGLNYIKRSSVSGSVVKEFDCVSPKFMFGEVFLF